MNKRLLFLFLIISLVFGCKGKGPSTDQTENLVNIKTAPVTRMDLSDTLRIYGTLTMRLESSLASQFDGRLTDFSLLLGDRVSQGQQIGNIIPAEREALLQVPEKSESAIDRALLEKQIKSISLVSPISGVVLQVYHHTGDVIAKGEPIIHIGNLDVLDVRGDLPVKYLDAVQKSSKIRVDFTDYQHAPLQLAIEAISGQINTHNQTVVLRLRLDNPEGKFKPGMLVTLSIPSMVHSNTLVVPRTALLENEGIYSVFVQHGDKVEQRQVVPGIFLDNRVEIVSGLTENEPVVTDKAYSLVDGMKVRSE